jgi:hypothetical protein
VDGRGDWLEVSSDFRQDGRAPVVLQVRAGAPAGGRAGDREVEGPQVLVDSCEGAGPRRVISSSPGHSPDRGWFLTIRALVDP